MSDRLRNGVDLRTFEGWKAHPSQIAIALDFEPTDRCIEAVSELKDNNIAAFESGEMKVSA